MDTTQKKNRQVEGLLTDNEGFRNPKTNRGKLNNILLSK